jgi:hypothetical protein
MAQTILIRRGTKAQLDVITLSQGELGFTTDTKECYVGDGTSNNLVGRALVGLIANRPAAGVSGRIYEATDENKTYLDNGVSWKLVGVASLDDVVDGSTYGKVLLTELESGQVKQIRAVTGAVDVSGDDLNTHITDDTKHRLINDSGTAATDLWSASKIDTDKADKVSGATPNNLAGVDEDGNLTDSGLKRNDAGTGTQDLWSANKISNEIGNTASGLSWQDPCEVLKMISDASQGANTPSSPAIGDAYVANNWGGGYVDGRIYEWSGSAWIDLGAIASGTRVIVTTVGAAGSFGGQEEKIAEYNGTTWIFTSPVEGWALLITGNGGVYENNGYTFSNSAWVQFTGAGQINAGIGIVKTGNTIDVNLGAGIGQLPTDEVGIDLVANDGLKLTASDTSGQLTVDYDNNTIGIDGNQLAVKVGGINVMQLNAAVAGNGLTGGGGAALAVGAGDGIQIAADAVALKVEADRGLAVGANGLRAAPDGFSVVIDTNGLLAVDTVDGGTFA